MFYQVLISILIGVGSFYLITEFIVIPTSRAKKAILSINGKTKGLSETAIITLAHAVNKFIKISEYKAASVQKKLYAAELNVSVNFYYSKAVASAIVVSLFGIPLLIISPLLTLGCIVLGIFVYFKEIQSADEIIKKKRKNIESELVLFSSTIMQSISASRDVIKIFESFRKVCGTELSHQLDITLADMKTGSYENALRRFDLRINSPLLSDIIRGLLAVLRGDDEQAYFDMLTHDLISKEKEQIKREALKKPQKLKFASYLLMFCAMAIIFYAIGYQIVTNLNKMF